MRAAIYTRYGPPDVVQVKEVEKPVPKDDEVLIKVRTAAVNPADWRLLLIDRRYQFGSSFRSPLLSGRRARPREGRDNHRQ